ncbi:4-hydroxybenzoate polyprenyltransferase-like prenyltransferase [Candidatus Nitrososphaera evergladensis SR1]|jgi:4-hydroxybenzoate polyprenyltransferase|uniref:4-hydroxybenzoate polyprenyltransferase-like prenyltransferase n=1 Tax=Candidatus Nitrososphaera evergladensis SR1 TaxID=1459636 RepID=A0A075MR69_9ARCH|nr:UbiA family prenyltransferase [Candidatus Nitrososphaera evergladensis]AIF83590.1 4-hydroxybenzoate polyprenyltransferase-like prenyltransferase [Candidatus Nitrososphaera evergladensis SR1]
MTLAGECNTHTTNKLTLKQGLLLLHSKKQPLGYATAGAVTYMFSSILAGSFSPFLNALVFGVLYAMYSAIYLYNDIVDLNIDKINSKDRLVASGKTTPRQAKKMVGFLFVIAALLTFLASSYFGPARGLQNYLTISVTVSASVFLGIIYSHPRIYLKKRFPFKSVSIASGAGLASLVGWAISSTDFTPSTLLSALSTSAVIFVMSILFDLRDLKGDRLHNVGTFPIVLGVDASRKMMYCNLAVPVLAAIITATLLGERVGPITLGILAAVSVIGIKALSRLGSNGLEDKKTFLNSVVTMRRLYYLTQLGMGSLAIGNMTTLH